MKKALVIVALLMAVGATGCIVEAGPCREASCWTIGAHCDYVGDQDCYSIQRLWYCHSDGLVYDRDCGYDCSGYAAACCGMDPARPGTENCLCCLTADCASASCYTRDY